MDDSQLPQKRSKMKIVLGAIGLLFAGWYGVSWYQAVPPYCVVPEYRGAISLSFSPDGRYLSIAGTTTKTAYVAKELECVIFDIQKAQTITTLAKNEWMKESVWTNDGKYLLVAGTSCEVYESGQWEHAVNSLILGYEQHWSLSVDDQNSLFFIADSDSNFMHVPSTAGYINIASEIRTRAELIAPPEGEEACSVVRTKSDLLVSYEPSGSILSYAVMDDDPLVDHSSQVFIASGQFQPPCGMVYQASKNLLAVLDAESLYLYKVSDSKPEQIHKWGRITNPIKSHDARRYMSQRVAISADGRFVAVATGEGTLVYRTTDFKRVKRIPVYSNSIAISHDGRFLAASETGKHRISIYEIETDK